MTRLASAQRRAIWALVILLSALSALYIAGPWLAPMPMCPSCGIYMFLYVFLPLLVIAVFILLVLLPHRPAPSPAPRDDKSGEIIIKLLPKAEREIYGELTRRGGEALLSDIAKALGLRKVRAWRAARRLEEKGLVEIEKIRGRIVIRTRKS